MEKNVLTISNYLCIIMALNGLFRHYLYTKKGSNQTPFFKVSPDKLINIRLLCEPGESLTHDQWLKRPLLYQLSYRLKIY